MGTLNTSARNMRSLSSTKRSRASIFETPLRLMSKPASWSLVASVFRKVCRTQGDVPSAAEVKTQVGTLLSELEGSLEKFRFHSQLRAQGV